MAACQTDAVRCTLIEDDHARRANLRCRLPRVRSWRSKRPRSRERLYVKENVVFVSDDADAYLSPGGIPPMRVARVTARVLLGEALPPMNCSKRLAASWKLFCGRKVPPWTSSTRHQRSRSPGQGDAVING